MTSINFAYNGTTTTIQCDEKTKFKEIFDKFCIKTGLDINTIFFIYAGNNNINTNLSVSEVASNEDKTRKIMNILVKKIDEDEKDEDSSIVESKEVICPKCGEEANIFFEDFKIKIECRAGHKIDNILLNEFKKTQFVDRSNIICGDCRESNMHVSFNNKFYRCIDCKINLCPLCRKKHDTNHFIPEYELRNFQCQKHHIDYDSYCRKCKTDLCKFCVIAHNQHSRVIFGDIMLTKKVMEAKADEIKNNFDKLNKDIEEIIKRFRKIQEFMNHYINIITFIIKNYDEKKINYIMLDNISRIIGNKDNYNYKELEELNKYEINTKAHKLLDIYNEMCIKYNDDFITLIHKINKGETKVALFNGEFVNNNKDVCTVILDGKEVDLSEYYDIGNLNFKNNILEVKLKGINKVKNASWMFSGLKSLISLPDLGQWDTKNVTDMNCMFSHFKSLGLPEDISKWNTSNVEDMNYMFSNCEILGLPDISKWNTSKVKEMSFIFSDCSSLIQLPDISKWDTRSLVEMKGMFNNCASLEKIPDISKWNTKNIKSMSNLFKSCSSLQSLPDISNWKTSNVNDMSYIFCECVNLTSLPDISKWNTVNVRKMSYMFCECQSLKSLPDINNWSTSNLDDKTKMFSNCDDSLEIPSKFRKKFLGIF